jgi:hypothetical protein
LAKKLNPYLIEDTETKTQRLVDAISGSAALRHVTSPRYTVRLASRRDIAEAMGKGVKLETAGAEPTE